MLHSARILKDQKDIAFLLVGDGVEKPKLLKLAQENHLDNVFFLPMQPKDKYPEVLLASDLCLVTLRQEVKTPVVPSKILSIMAAGRPVLASLPLDGDAPRLIAEAGCGHAFLPATRRPWPRLSCSLLTDQSCGEQLGASGQTIRRAPPFTIQECGDSWKDTFSRSLPDGVAGPVTPMPAFSWPMFRLFSMQISKWKFLLLGGDAAMYVLAVFLSLYSNPKLDLGTCAFLAVAHLVAFPSDGAHLFGGVSILSTTMTTSRDYRRWSNIAQLILSVAMGTVVIIIFFYFPTGSFIGRVHLVGLRAATFAGLMLLWRLTFSALALPQRLQAEADYYRRWGEWTPSLGGFSEPPPQRPGRRWVLSMMTRENSAQISPACQCWEVVASYWRLSGNAMVNLVVVAITHEKSPAID